METRIKEVAKQHGLSLNDLAEKLKISRQGLRNYTAGNPSMAKLNEVAQAIGCTVLELINTPEDYSHFYDSDTGEWLGIRKK